MTRGAAACLLLCLGSAIASARTPVAAPNAATHGRSASKDAVAASHYLCGRARYAAGDYAEALAEFQTGYAALPLPALLVNIGQCLRKLERLDEAADTYRAYLESNAGDARVRAEVAEALDEVQSARTFLNRAAMKPRRAQSPAEANAQLMHHWGRTYFVNGQYEEALAQFQAAYARFPAAALLVNIGQCLRKLDRLDEAAQAFNGFLSLRSGDAHVRAEVFEALDAVLDELDRRLYSLAISAAQFKAFLESGEGSPVIRAAVSHTRRELLKELVRIDGVLSKQLRMPPPPLTAKPGANTAGRWRMLLHSVPL